MTDYPMTCTYGGRECCEAADFRVTRTDATGTVTYKTCTAHRDECSATQARYVDGWGDVTLTIRRKREAVGADAPGHDAACESPVLEFFRQQTPRGVEYHTTAPGGVHWVVRKEATTHGMKRASNPMWITYANGQRQPGTDRYLATAQQRIRRYAR